MPRATSRTVRKAVNTVVWCLVARLVRQHEKTSKDVDKGKESAIHKIGRVFNYLLFRVMVKT